MRAVDFPMSAMPRRSFRLVCKPEQIPLVERLLLAEGFAFEPEPFFPLARRLMREPLPLGSSLAATFGYAYIQDRSSMLPPLVLNPPQGASVLDMCASPGSKTGLLGQCVGDTGFVLGNEPAKSRLATLRRNLQNLNSFCCSTCSHPGEKIPLPGADAMPPGSGWGYIQLDPPCSGWGTVDKNPQVMRLWKGDKIQPLITLQRRLLAEAGRLLRPGGLLVYSTCTTNTAENEDQLAYACDELNFVLIPVEPPEGFAFDPAARPGFSGVLRVGTGVDGQGFFVALLKKPENAPQETATIPSGLAALPASFFPETGAPASANPGEELARGFFLRPWEKASLFVGERRRFGKTNARAGQSSFPLVLPLSCIAGPYTDPGMLPPGKIAVFNSVAHFLPRAALAMLPAGFTWKGFPLGRAGRGDAVRVSPHLRALMPTAEAAEAQGLPVLNLTETTPLRTLLSGQSLAVSMKGPEIGLYYCGLPLCRLSVKGRRAILSA
jgi:16S rRNA (cytosine1407-C5)-methyltransferase